MNTSNSGRGRSTWILSVVCGLMMLLGALSEGVKAQTTTRVGVDSNGNEGNDHSGSTQFDFFRL